MLTLIIEIEVSAEIIEISERGIEIWKIVQNIIIFSKEKNPQVNEGDIGIFGFAVLPIFYIDFSVFNLENLGFSV